MRFGVVVFSAESASEWRDKAVRYEAIGFDHLHVPDHIGSLDPFAASASAAAATKHIGVGTLVLNVEFWNPLLLARAAVTTQLVSGGRFVLGLGAGHAQVEFEQAGIPYPPPKRRAQRLEAMARVIPRLAAGETVDDEQLGLVGAIVGLPTTTIPILIGGNGDQVLKAAGRFADIVGLVGFTSGTGQTQTDLSHWSWEGLQDRIEFVRRSAKERGDPPEFHILVQFAAITADPERALAGWLEAGEPIAPHLDSPFVIVGELARVNEHVARLHEMGVRSLSVFEDSADAIAQVIPNRA